MAVPLGFDKEKVHFNLARLKKEGYNFEVVVDPDLAIKFRQDKSIDIRDILKSEHIFSDAPKGDLASEKAMEEIFGTNDELEIARKILAEGEIQLTTEYREQLLEKKKRIIAEIISKNGIDPRTKLPHPVERILNAMKEAKVKVDMFKRAEDQVKDIVRKISVILPISIELVVLEVTIPAKYSAKAYNLIKSISNPGKEEWLSDGSLKIEVQIPAGLQLDFMDKINKLTHGDNEIVKRTK